MKKGIVLMLLLSIFPALAFAGTRDRQLTFTSIPAACIVDATTYANSKVLSYTATSCVLGAATGCSITALLVPASTSAAFVANFRVPNDYLSNGKFYLNCKPVSADTTAQFRLDIQVQELNSLTTTAVTNGTNSTAMAAGNDSQFRDILLDNGASFGPNSILALYISRIAGTSAVVNVFSINFKYHASALVK